MKRGQIDRPPARDILWQPLRIFGLAPSKAEGGRVAYDVRRARKIRANRRRR